MSRFTANCRHLPILAAAVWLATIHRPLSGQEPPAAAAPAADAPAADAPAQLIQIADEPKAIDPATLVAPPLAAKVKVQFQESSLSEVASWVQQQTKLHVILERRSLENAGILTSEPVVDQLSDEPLYLLLDRLSHIGVDWRFEKGVIRLSGADQDDRVFTTQYNVGDLFDAGHQADSLQEVIEATIVPDSWDTVGGPGGIVVLGDVLFVRQSNLGHRHVAGLLAGLRKHARRTLILDPASHDRIRESLAQPLTVSFRDAPLAAVVEQLANLSKADIRLDRRSLSEEGVRVRIPVELAMEAQPLRTILDVLVEQLELDWQLKQGVLWVTTRSQVEEDCKTAVFDVRDLCRDANEADALLEAITSQANPDSWDEVGGPGSIAFPIPGAMVVCQTERMLDEVLQLLENYRTALRASKQRQRPETDPKTVITRYYRMPANVAADLVAALPLLASPKTWRTPEQPDAPGVIQKTSSWSEAKSHVDPPASAENKKPAATVWIEPYAVLIIRQMREVHDEIAVVLQKIEHGEADAGGFGMGGGGFGGGFFSVESLLGTQQLRP